MIFEETGIEGKEVVVEDLNHFMEELGFIHWTWDYRRATYDYKFEDKKTRNVYYLRVPCKAIVGEIHDGHCESVVQMLHPYIGKHIYPHGFDYEFNFPQQILDYSEKKLAALSEKLKQLEE